MSGKYGDLIKQARKPENQKNSQTAPTNQTGETTEEVTATEPEVNLCVKVPVSLRRHWSAEAKRQGTTMTSVIVEALKAKFGEPG